MTVNGMVALWAEVTFYGMVALWAEVTFYGMVALWAAMTLVGWYHSVGVPVCECIIEGSHFHLTAISL